MGGDFYTSWEWDHRMMTGRMFRSIQMVQRNSMTTSHAVELTQSLCEKKESDHGNEEAR